VAVWAAIRGRIGLQNGRRNLAHRSELKITNIFSFNEEKMGNVLDRAINNINYLIHRKASQVSRLRGMGSTFVPCLIRGTVASIANMGDSRAYLIREGILERLTENHTIVGLMHQLGQITKKKANKHPARHALTRHVGVEGSVEPGVGLLDLKKGDRLLLCSDGLTNELADREIGKSLLSVPEIE
jgi:serine/threonine protein phosphatase PrpC